MNIYRNISELPVFQNAVITIGSFDGVHKGHQTILERMAKLATEVNGESVVISFYPHPRSVIYPKDSKLFLLNSIEEKIELLQKYGIQNLVLVPFSVEFSQLQAREYVEKFIIQKFNPKFIVIGYDHRFGINRLGDVGLLKSYQNKGAFEVLEISKQEMENITISSTKVRTALNEGDIEVANSFLGYPYPITGKVVYGDKIGSTIGFPTANIQVHYGDKLIPKDGVYAVKVNHEDTEYDGMMYIGSRPSIHENGKRKIEVHIFDFNENIYDKNITLRLYHYLRDDMKFDDLGQLKDQLYLDEKNARIFLENITTKEIKNSKCIIAILNYNGVEYLESFLPKVLYSSKVADVEVVVIDNHSTDESINYLKDWHPEIQLIELTQNYGFAGGYNKGLKNVEAEYYVLLNSDVLVTEGWLDPIVKMMDKDKSIAAVQPLILSLEDKNSFEYAGAAGGFQDILAYPFCRGRIFDTLEQNNGQYNSSSEIFWSSGAAMVVRSSVFNKLGGFDDTYFAHQEEIDFCWRAKRAGYKIMVNGDSKIYHLGGGTLAYQSSKKIFLNFRNNLISIYKNETYSNLLWKFPMRLILDGVAGLKFLFEGNVDFFKSILKAHFNFYKLLPKIHSIKKEDQKRIDRNRIDFPNLNGNYEGLIVWDYFVKDKKIFSDFKSKKIKQKV